MDNSNNKFIYYSPDISWTLLEGEVFVFNEINDEITILRGIEKDFWLLISQYTNIQEILEELSKIHPGFKMEQLNKVKRCAEKKLIVWDDAI